MMRAFDAYKAKLHYKSNRKAREPIPMSQEKLTRNIGIINDRKSGMTLAKLSVKYDLTAQQCGKIYRDWLQADPPMPPPTIANTDPGVTK